MSKKMPEYIQHKIVRAARIEAVADDQPEHVTLQLSTGALVREPTAWYERMLGNLRKRPLVGCYYVEYPDGYTSASPAEAFETGNTALAQLSSEPLEARCENGRLVISLGIETLTDGLTSYPELIGLVDQGVRSHALGVLMAKEINKAVSDSDSYIQLLLRDAAREVWNNL